MDTFDDDLLRHVMSSVGLAAAGVVYIQLWVLNEHRNLLVQPSAGAWLDPVFHSCPCQQQRRSAISISGYGSTEDRSTPDEESQQTTCQLCRIIDKKHHEYIPPEPLPIGVGLAGILWAEATSSHHITWRNLEQLANDPHQPYSPRLQHLANNCGFGMAAAVPFNVLGEEGIIVCIYTNTRSSKYKTSYITN